MSLFVTLLTFQAGGRVNRSQILVVPDQHLHPQDQQQKRRHQQQQQQQVCAIFKLYTFQYPAGVKPYIYILMLSEIIAYNHLAGPPSRNPCQRSANLHLVFAMRVLNFGVTFINLKNKGGHKRSGPHHREAQHHQHPPAVAASQNQSSRKYKHAPQSCSSRLTGWKRCAYFSII